MNRSRNRMNSFVVGKNAERERNRVRCLRAAFQTLQGRLPTVPPNTKLSKLDILILATNYINQLTKLLQGANIQESALNQHLQNKFFHPIKKWPMRKRLYSRINSVKQVDNDDDHEEDEADDDDGEEEYSQKQQTQEQPHHQPQQQFHSNLEHLHEYESQFDTEAHEYCEIPEKYSSHIDLIWFPTYDM